MCILSAQKSQGLARVKTLKTKLYRNHLMVVMRKDEI